MRLTLFINSLGGAGAERMMSTLANHWAVRGESVHLVTRPTGIEDFYALHPAVQRRSAAMPAARLQAARYVLRLRTLREVFAETKPDLILSFINVNNVEALLAARGLGIPVIVSERNNPREESTALHHRVLRRLLYSRAAAVVVQTESVRRWASFMPPERLAVIPNLVAAPPPSPPQSRERLIVAVGRLIDQKGFDLLIAAFARIVSQLPDWRLVVLGEGHRRAELERQVISLDLGGRVALPGVVRDTHSWFRRAGLFVLSSRFEGFPNVLLEAMATGAPIVATDCPSGPSEIVRHDHDGLLVPIGVGPLAEAMLKLCRAPDERARLGANAVEVITRFHPDRIIPMWDDLCRRCLDAAADKRPSAPSPRRRLVETAKSAVR
jgi:glycosyltransferase involved in cell wall biosynthesis